MLKIAQMPLARVLSTLWKMLSSAQRLHFILLISLLLVSGLFEMGGMLFIFGFIGGLKIDEETGERAGRLTSLFEFLHGGVMDSREYVIVAGSLVLLVLVMKNTLATLVQFGLNRFLMKLNQRVSERLLSGFLLTPLEQVNRRGVSGVTEKISKIFDVFSVSFGALALILADGIMLCMVVLLLLAVDPGLTIGAALLFGAIGGVMYQKMQRLLVAMGRADVAARRQASQYLNDGLRGLVDVRLRDARANISRGYAQALQTTALQRRRITALERLPRSVNEMALALMIVSAVFYLTYSGGSIEEALPTLGIFGFAGMRLTAAMTRLSQSFQRLKRSAEEFETYYEAIVEVSPQTFGEKQSKSQSNYLNEEVHSPPGREVRLHNQITATAVCFSYHGAKVPAVDCVSLSIPQGSFVSFCGPSGGGKSTLVLLLLGLLKPQQGEITCDGWNIFHHIRAWHRNVGFVSQQMYVANRTIRENVAFAVPAAEIDDKRVWAALKLASADEFVRKLSHNIRHKLNENGANLSGGQRQRVIIARALYSDPDIVVFDEATAALDNATERAITQAIGNLSGSKTIICVAHRLSTIRRSDAIHVIEDGRITASGTYDELLNSSETFQSLARDAEKK